MGLRTVHKASSEPLVGDVARRLLRQRLRAVASAADAVAAGMPRPAAIHRLRVVARRAAAALTAFRPLVPPRHRRWFRRVLRGVRRSVGETRDLDVILARVRTAASEGGRSAAGAAARRRLVAMLAKQRSSASRSRGVLDAREWDAHTAALLAAVASAGANEPFAPFRRRRSRRLVGRFLAILDRRLRDGDGIHRLRIETKKLRYVLDVFAAGTVSVHDSASARPLERLQTRLGEFTDREAAADHLRRLARREADDRCRELLAEARRRESTAARRARRECIRWWNSSRRRRLARQLGRSVRGTIA